MHHSDAPTNGYEALEASHTYVTKVDGGNADIHFISQGLNESVMTFLVSSKDADRAVQVLHDIFIALDDESYLQLQHRFREQVLAAIASSQKK